MRQTGAGRRWAATGAGALIAVTALAGCATVRSDAPTSTDAAAAASVDETGIAVTTGYATVIERERVVACVAAVLQSNPPWCGGGLELEGWDWAALEGTFTEREGTVAERAGVRWGDYVVHGVYDPESRVLTVTSAEPAEPDSASDVDPMGPIMKAGCPEPAGGWQITDPEKANQESLMAATNALVTLDGYATSWLDRSLLPPVPEGADPLAQLDHAAEHAGLYILTVAVHGDTAAAEQVLRAVWGGALCVISADYSEAERAAQLKEIMAAHEGEILVAGPDPLTGQLHVTVTYDLDGALQQELDAQYGPGLVQVHSALIEE